MTESAPKLAKVLEDAIESSLIGVHTAMPAVVLSYNASNQSCTVQPVVRAAFLDETDARVAEKLPSIQGVPVVFPGSGGYSITWPISPGDTVLLNFAECSIDRWLAQGGSDVDPGDDHHHHVSDAIAIPGLRAFATALSATAIDGSAMVLSAPQIKLGDATAIDALIKGTTYTTAEGAFLSAMTLFFTALQTVTLALTTDAAGGLFAATAPATTSAVLLPTFPAAIAAGLTAVATFHSALSSTLSTKVKTV